MKSFPSGIHFKYQWRTYQRHFLDRFDEYLKNGHLHIVAPPGSGKTVLGLEVMLRINKPALIVAPTLAIRNQWMQRFRELFLHTEHLPEWISDDIYNPGFVTVTTYQGLHAACNKKPGVLTDEKSPDPEGAENNFSQITRRLKQQKIETFILDEAHHLKNAWWKSLTDLKKEISPKVVALTATPPFDVSGAEWQKYIQLNGPVDIEISVPELMIEGDLCPHQDLVYFTSPTEQEKHTIENHYHRARTIFEEVNNDKVLLHALENHDLYQNPEQHLDWIYDHLSSYTSGLVYLNFRGKEIADIHFKIIGDEKKLVPEFDFFWLEELLDFYFFTDDLYFKQFHDHRSRLENRVRRNGFLENKTVCFFDNKKVHQMLNSSIGKLEGIKEIVNFEYSVLGDGLKMLVLTDFIKKEFLATHHHNGFEIDKTGAIPIFEKLRRENPDHKKIGVLTGSLVIIPKGSENVFDLLCRTSKVSAGTELSYDGNYLVIHITDAVRHAIVHIITEMFQSGEIHVLIGTKSLLGEGWDAPKMNALILASFVSSFVLSNQMRGRVIRTDKDCPDKTGNIWHLVCFDGNDEIGSKDLDILKKRFKTFVGVSNNDENTIENNFERLHIKIEESKRDLSLINLQTFAFAGDRKNLSNRWKKALAKGNILIEEIQVPKSEMRRTEEMKLTYLKKMLGNFSGIMISTGITFLHEVVSEIVKSYDDIHSMDGFFKVSMVAGIIGILTCGMKFIRACRQYFKYKKFSKYLQAMGNVVLESLIHEKIIKTPPQEMSVVTADDVYKSSVCHLEGGSRYEKSIFIRTLQELISPVDNPRYLIQQEEKFLFVKTGIYFPVPEIMGKNKASAAFFRKKWSENFAHSELIFTRTPEGRKILLQLRFRSLMNRNTKIEQINKWVK
ncbi:DEAD/DEAH box helicase family protein [Chryseobacterium hagamense]|uniref:Helicase ATP-binding domain-containing protein n=1 Tax=Chryseobacterium hagamense TaxID=395935 RepID=A0A511YJ13_9FLAO|nr:DEAD/DEAH box helicase family protein [Chryseobacterium hagamense]GEN75191.1 hypothetical protein CHA01nite_09310 [Chryseobacterium hagamense]